jgi:hypothetical protein
LGRPAQRREAPGEWGEGLMFGATSGFTDRPDELLAITNPALV